MGKVQVFIKDLDSDIIEQLLDDNDLFSNRVYTKCEDCDVITDCSLTQLVLANVLFNI